MPARHPDAVGVCAFFRAGAETRQNPVVDLDDGVAGVIKDQRICAVRDNSRILVVDEVTTKVRFAIEASAIDGERILALIVL